MNKFDIGEAKGSKKEPKKKNIVFIDSGIGGLYILKECIKLIPNYNFVYVADTENFPYGSKSRKELIKIADNLVSELDEKFDPEIFVLACNTLTVNAIQFLRNKYNKKFVGIEPALKTAKIYGGDTIIFATRSTLKHYSKLNKKCIKQIKKEYKQKKLRFSNNDKFFKVFVADLPLKIEQSCNDLKVLMAVLTNTFDKPEFKNVSNLVLGCTHFIAIKKLLQQILGEDVQIFDGAKPVAKRIFSLIESKNNQSSTKKKNLEANEVLKENNETSKAGKMLKEETDNEDETNIENKIVRENEKLKDAGGSDEIFETNGKLGTTGGDDEMLKKANDTNETIIKIASQKPFNFNRIKFLVTDGNPRKKALLKQYFYKIL